MLVAIDPVLEGQPFGLGAKNIEHLIVGTKLQGRTLFPISHWPAYVYVARVLDDTVLRGQEFTRHQVELIAWGALYRERAEALALRSNFGIDL